MSSTRRYAGAFAEFVLIAVGVVSAANGEASGQLAPVFAYLLMTLGMPSPRLNWVLAQLAIVVSALVSALVLVAFGAAPFLYLALTLLWIFTCVLFTNWFSLPATLGAMVSALGIFVFFDGDVGGTLGFYVAYGLNFLIAGFSVAVVHTLLWQLNTRKVFLERVAAVYARLEDQCRDAARRLAFRFLLGHALGRP